MFKPNPVSKTEQARQFIEAYREAFNVAVMYRMLGVARAGYSPGSSNL